MRGLWWSLPGPDEFVSRAVRDLEDGRSVVIGRPATGPEGIGREVQRRSDADQWRVLDRGALHGREPAELLLWLYWPDMPAGTTVSARTFATCERAYGCRVLLSLEDTNAWSRWRPFLEEVSELTRHLPPFDRPLFCVEVVGEAALTPARESPALVWLPWRGVVEPGDMRIYAAAQLRERRLRPHEAACAAGIIAELALWDPELADQLAREPLRSLAEPATLLREIAVRRGWEEACSNSPADPAAWAWGQAERVAPGHSWHAAILATRGDHSELRRRVWRGQVSSIFPLLEHLRVIAITRLANVLRPPFEVPGDQINDPLLLEIGHLEFILRNGAESRADPTVREAVTRLRRMRNALAHMDLVDVDDLLHPDVLRLMEE